MTAQDQYRLMLKEFLTPALRKRGWSGGSGRYYLHAPTGHVASLLLFGNARRSNAVVRTFHLNIGVVSRYLREYHEGADIPTPKRPSYALEHDWMEEVASFTITEDDDALTVGAFVWSIVETQAIPRVTASLADDGLRRAVDGCPVGVGKGAARTLMEIVQGNLETARAEVDSYEAAWGSDDPRAAFLRRRLREAAAGTE